MADPYFDFWFHLHGALDALGVPMKRRTDKAADIGWGRGYRMLIIDN